MTEEIIKVAGIQEVIQAAREQPVGFLQNWPELTESGLILWAFCQN